MNNINQIIHGDSLEYMKTLPDKSIDLVLTDPPYWIHNKLKTTWSTNKWNAFAQKYMEKQWDKERPSKEFFDEIIRVWKNCIIFWWNYFSDLLPPSRWWIIWDKMWEGMTSVNDELAYTSFDKAIVKFQRCHWLDKWFMVKNALDASQHPTQKPKELFKWCLENYSKPWDLVLDCFAWSGTTAVACIETGRNYIVIEKEADYVEIIKKRVKNTTPPLFVN